jgi:hypothetical protein
MALCTAAVQGAFALDQEFAPAQPYRSSMKRLVFLLALLVGNAAAQYTAPARQVLALAPELEAFAGSKANFESLASGLRGGTAIKLVSLTPDGMREIITFTAAEALPAIETASVLENARYRLLERGIARPSGWDIALVLMGSMDIAPSGPVRRPGLLAPADPLRPMILSLRPFAGSAGNYRSLMHGLTQGWTVTLTDPVEPRSRFRFTPPCTLSEDEARALLLAAAERLGAQGIGDPMITEVGAAVVGLLQTKCGPLAAIS